MQIWIRKNSHKYDIVFESGFLQYNVCKYNTNTTRVPFEGGLPGRQRQPC